MDRQPADRDIASFYNGAVLGLRYQEAAKPTGRRFGADADARWASFRGDLTTSDRIDLLIRDANAQWPEAFGARTTFAERAVAEDEPFGPGFASLDPVDAEALWRAQLATPPAADLGTLLGAVAAAWGIRLAPHDPGPIGPADKLIVVGPSAIVSLILAFHKGGRDFDWRDQVAVVATPPGHRQIAALGGALLGITQRATLIAADDDPASYPGLRGRLIAGPDADPTDVQRARALAS